jgi:hypothetical protein
MSQQSSRFFSTKPAKVDYLRDAEVLAEIKDWKEGKTPRRDLTLDDLGFLKEIPDRYTNVGRYVYISGQYRDTYLGDALNKLQREGKSRGARYIAARLISTDYNPKYVTQELLDEMGYDYVKTTRIKASLTKEEMESINATPARLRHLGIEFGWQARRFFDLYSQINVKDRPWGSCYQPSHHWVLKVACTPNYNRLPVWVKKTLIVTQNVPDQHHRIGDIWRLINCTKAWKWCPQLPKNIAEKIGKSGSVKARIFASLAWNTASQTYRLSELHRLDWERYSYETDSYFQISRAALINDFWTEFRRLEKASLPELAEVIFREFETGEHRGIFETLLGLPHRTLKSEWPSYGPDYAQEVLNLVVSYSTPEQACQHLFGVSGKATVKAFAQCHNQDAWKWASALGNKNPDKIQKILSLPQCVGFEPEAVEFLQNLGDKTQVRLLSKTTFRYRGEDIELSQDYVRDTGYLWKNIQNKPELGRVRCWFSVHETLSAAFVEELPDEVLPIPQGWQPVDGLAEVNQQWEIKLPKRVNDLKLWGKLLNNCVGGYGPAVQQNRSVIFGVFEEGRISHCVEVDPTWGRVNQFYKRNNQYADPQIRESVVSSLSMAGLVKENW